MTVKNRLQKINKIANVSTVVFDNSKYNGKIIYRCESLRTGKPFQVVTEMFRNGILMAKVQLYTFDHKQQVNDKGNHPADFNKRTVCYQALGALKKRAKDSGKVLSLCNDYQSAKKLLNLGGEIVQIRNLAGGTVWGTLR